MGENNYSESIAYNDWGGEAYSPNKKEDVSTEEVVDQATEKKSEGTNIGSESGGEAYSPNKKEDVSTEEVVDQATEKKSEGTKEIKDNVTRGKEIYGSFKKRMSGVMEKVGKFGDRVKDKIFGVLGATAAGAEKGANRIKQIVEKAGDVSSNLSEKVIQINEKVSSGFFEAGKTLGKSIAESSDMVLNKAKDIGLSQKGLIIMQKIVWNKNKFAQMPNPEEIKALQAERRKQIDAQAEYALKEYENQKNYLDSLGKNLANVTQELNKRKSAKQTVVLENN
jgi:hypothetical protein